MPPIGVMDTSQKRFVRWRWPVLFVALLAWLHVLPAAAQWAVWPGQLEPWWGPWTFHLRHASLGHLLSNAVPLLALGTLFGSVYPKAAPRAWALFFLAIGPLVWGVGRPGPHIGASGLVYALFHCLVAMAVLRRDRPSVASMFAATVVFGGLWLGALRPEEGISWEGHLAGALVGWSAALFWARLDPKPAPHVWEDELTEPQHPLFSPTPLPPPAEALAWPVDPAKPVGDQPVPPPQGFWPPSPP